MAGRVKIVLVEDEEEHAELVRRAFAGSDQDVHLEVLDTVDAASARLAVAAPDLVIIDLRLSDGDGTDLLSADEEQSYPTVILTGHGDERSAAEAMELGAMDYVVKSEASIRALPRIADRALRAWRLVLERDRAEAALRESDERYRMLVEDVPFLVLRFLPSGEIRYVNDRYCTTRGLPSDQILGRNVFEVAVGDGPEVIPESLTGLTADQSATTLERPVLESTGQIRWERWTYRALFDDHGEVAEFQSLGEDITERKGTEEELEPPAMRDVLTGLPNRRQFLDRMGRALETAQRTSREVALLHIDLDGFEAINNSFGHHFGDELLTAVANRLEKCVRGTDFVARLDGDELAIIIEGPASAGDVVAAAVRVVASISEGHRIDGREVAVTASIGVSRYPHDADTLAGLMVRAERAMRTAKINGKNRYQMWVS